MMTLVVVVVHSAQEVDMIAAIPHAHLLSRVFLQLVFRLATGVFCNGYKLSIIPKQPDRYTILTLFDKYQISETSTIPPQLQQREPLILYDIESCPYCRKVREAVSILSLDVIFRPCPKNGYPWRRFVKEKYTVTTFPFLVDPNTQAQCCDSNQILEYLFSTYGNGKIPITLTPNNSFVTASQVAGLLFRGTNGGVAKPSNKPPFKPLTLHSYEGSPFCKLVKEKLCELELEHLQISCPRGSINRQKLFEKKGRFQVPYLQDDNTGVQLFESQAILEYLEKQYAIAKSPVKYM